MKRKDIISRHQKRIAQLNIIYRDKVNEQMDKVKQDYLSKIEAYKAKKKKSYYKKSHQLLDKLLSDIDDDFIN